MEVSASKKIEILEAMLRIRLFEEKILELISIGEIDKGYHISFGHEAAAVGVCSLLQRDDYVTSNHRGPLHYLAKGGDPRKLMAELYGKATGCCSGKGGEMLLVDRSIGLLYSSTFVGANISVAVGIGFAIKKKMTGQVVAAFFGDGASCNASFHEALNIAAVHKLPVLFVCENNEYSINVHQSEWMAAVSVANMAAAYNIPGILVDGTSVFDVINAANEAIRRARNGEGPTLIDAKVVRIRSHKETVPDNRDPDLIRDCISRDPLPRYINELMKQSILSDELLLKMKEKIRREVEESVSFARESPYPEEI